MSLKSFACMAALAAITMPAAALPTISLVETTPGTVALQVTADAAGSLGAELAIDLGDGLSIVDGTVAIDPFFDQANPGDNPFINGLDSPIGGDTTGLAVDLAGGTIFAAYGAPTPVALNTPFNFLTFDVTGSGDIDAFGLVAQGAVLNDGLTAMVTIADVGGLAADFNGDGTVDLLDLDILGSNFGGPGDAMTGDANGDGTVDLLDLDILGSQFGQSGSTSIPEPTAVLLGLIALGGVAVRRR